MKRQGSFGKTEEVVRISGTLDAVASYIKSEYEISHRCAVKISLLLLMEQEAEFSEGGDSNFSKFSKESIESFYDDSFKSKGMIGSTRVFFNITNIKVELMHAIPEFILEWLINHDNTDILKVKAFFLILKTLVKNAQLIKDEHVCVCCKAWDIARKNQNKQFCIDDLFPEADTIGKITEYNCPYAQEDGTQKKKLSRWKCVFYKNGNYCDLTKFKLKCILETLEKLQVIESVEENRRYCFL